MAESQGRSAFFVSGANMPAPPLGLTARATVERVIDGDTVDVLVRIPVRVRLLDCWAPEVHGAEANKGKRSKSQLETLLPVDSHVTLQVPTANVDALSGVFTFGRVLGNVWRQGDDESVSQLMVGMGMATQHKEPVA